MKKKIMKKSQKSQNILKKSQKSEKFHEIKIFALFFELFAPQCNPASSERFRFAPFFLLRVRVRVRVELGLG